MNIVGAFFVLFIVYALLSIMYDLREIIKTLDDIKESEDTE